ncbi:hypothetical protein GH714_021304 [Hevea brasiliensis]|uniref:Pyrophosphate--fructose 6-phosphate 1-phosphotransferase subunit beta n=1 Tax=Hevea brasiliensis TaxID=3981 RepID=A0A6A6LT92_HEVBR|nr:hypothetical protein GH714_021304 [Hevea brasiliensis]
MAPSFVINGEVPTVKSSPATGRFASVYSELQASRIDHSLPVPSVLKNPFKVVEGPQAPLLAIQPSSMFVPNGADAVHSNLKLKIGVVLSGGQAPGGHNVISGIFDYLQERAKGSILYGFRGGPAGIMKCKYVELTADFIYPYRNQGGFDMICSGRDKIETPEQFKQAEETALKLDLDGLVVIGGDDSNTNACLLAENFRSKNMKTRVIGCPKTIDGDLKCKEVPTSFGFDTACKIYSEMIGNVMIDARSTGKYYHCELSCVMAMQQVAAKKLTLKNVTDYIVDIICKRADLGYNYGVILIPEGLIDFIPEVQHLIAELNEILARDVVDEGGLWKKKLTSQSLQLFEFLPLAIREQLMLERDPHGNVQVAKIETEKMLIQMVETELEKRKQQGSYKAQFKGQSHFFGYEGRCGLPTNFDATYCYALGYGAGALLHSGKTGLISSVGNLGAPVAEWTVGGTALTSMMDVERRHGKFKPVIKKAMVELEGAPFKKFASMRNEWALKNRYISPGSPPHYSLPNKETSPRPPRLRKRLSLSLSLNDGQPQKNSQPRTPTTSLFTQKRKKKQLFQLPRIRVLDGGASSSAELNINIWPFSRSRSAGNSGARPRIFPGTRKVSSAPCSRSNSAGESKSRKWLSSPGRGTGVHLGRSSPVWQVRRGGGVTEAKSGYSEAVNRSGKKMTSKTRKEDGKVVNLNVPMCNGCTEPLNCRSSSSKSNVAGGGTGNLFSYAASSQKRCTE